MFNSSNFKFIICLLLPVILLFSCTTNKLEHNKNLSLEDNTKPNATPNIISDNNLIYNSLKDISSNIRNYGSNGEISTYNYLKTKLLEYNYSVESQEFKVYKQDMDTCLNISKNSDYFILNPYHSSSLGTGINVIAKNENFDNSKKTLYLTAHYDTTDFTQGVIDNGTGTTVVLNIARILQDFNNDFNIVPVFFSAEEYFRYGSKYFVANLSDSDLENTLGCINIDIVGDINAGPIIQQTPTGENNILSFYFNKTLDNSFDLYPGGSSDELSFYMRKIPTITLTDKEPNYYLDRENINVQLDNVDITKLNELSASLSTFLINFDISKYYSNLEYEFDSLKNTDNKMTNLGNFKLTNVNKSFLDNGFDIKTTYNYSNGNRDFVLTEQDIKFTDISNFTFSNNDPQWGYKIKNTTNLIFSTPKYYCEIIGSISSSEAINILENYYINYYTNLFKKPPKASLF